MIFHFKFKINKQNSITLLFNLIKLYCTLFYFIFYFFAAYCHHFLTLKTFTICQRNFLTHDFQQPFQFSLITVQQNRYKQMQPQSQLSQCLKRLIPAVQHTTTSPTGNPSYTMKLKQTQQQPKYPIGYHFKTIKNIPITQAVKDRLNSVRQLPEHENLVSVIAKGYETSKQQVYILSDYFTESQSLQKIVQNKKRVLTVGELNSIFYQVVRAMCCLQQKQVNHLRLNPSAILVHFSDDLKVISNPVVRICDLGIAAQDSNQYHHKYCLHYHYFDKQQQIYSKPYNQCIAYDLWALGSIIYLCIKEQKPFLGKDTSQFFGNKKIFKVKHVKAPEAWLARDDNAISQSHLLERFIAKCWGINKNNAFKSWAEALEYYEQKDYKATRIQKIQIRSIFQNHIRVIFLFSKIYIILRQQIQYETTKLLKNRPNNKELVNRLSLYLFKISDIMHKEEFQKHFKSRCSVLQVEQRLILTSITEKLCNQQQFLSQNSIISKPYTFSYLISGADKLHVELKMRCKQIESYITPKIKLIQQFFEQFNECARKAEQILKHRQRHHSEMLYIFYESQKFKRMADLQGYTYTKFTLLSLKF